jgi:hypothetical protein
MAIKKYKFHCEHEINSVKQLLKEHENPDGVILADWQSIILLASALDPLIPNGIEWSLTAC